MKAPRELTIDGRTFQEAAALAAVTPDDVQRARRDAASVCTAAYRRYLAAGLDPRELEPPDDGGR